MLMMPRTAWRSFGLISARFIYLPPCLMVLIESFIQSNRNARHSILAFPILQSAFVHTFTDDEMPGYFFFLFDR